HRAGAAPGHHKTLAGAEAVRSARTQVEAWAERDAERIDARRGPGTRHVVGGAAIDVGRVGDPVRRANQVGGGRQVRELASDDIGGGDFVREAGHEIRARKKVRETNRGPGAVGGATHDVGRWNRVREAKHDLRCGQVIRHADAPVGVQRNVRAANGDVRFHLYVV